MKKRLLTIVALLAGLCALALPKLWPMLREAPHGPSTFAHAPPTPTPQSASMAVQVVKLQPTTFAETITATGTLRADEGVELQAETSGKIVAISFQEGAAVRQGDLLVKIYDADLQASRQRALARQMLAENRERRLAQLLRDGGANQQDLDAARSELQVQLAEAKLIEAQIAKTEICAPFDGIIGLRFVSPGAYVSPATRIATLQHVASMKVDFAIPEKYAARVRVGQTVDFTVASDPSTFNAEIYAFEPRVEETTRTLLLRATCPNPDSRLLPGAFANVAFPLTARDDALLVPAAAVVPGLVDKNVFVVENGRAVRRSVQTGARTATAVEIVAGLRAGDLVITSGLQALRSGQPVQPRSHTP